MATIENTITPDSTLEKNRQRIKGFDINSSLYIATKNTFSLGTSTASPQTNDTILHFTKDNFITLNGRIYGTGGGFYYLNPLYEKIYNGKKLTNESDADNFVITYGFDGKLTHVYYTTSDNKTVFIDTLKKSNNEIFQIKTTNDGIRYYRTISSTASTNTPWEIESYQRIHKELGNFGTEQEALDALAKVEICGNKYIVHVHLTYGGYANIIMIQSIENNYCRQIIFNKSKLFQRAIYFKDSARTQISYKEDWSFLFGDRLKWDCSNNKYILSQFENSFNANVTDSIPTVTPNNDGLMPSGDFEFINEFMTYVNDCTIQQLDNITSITIPSLQAAVNILSSNISQSSLRPLKIVGIENNIEVGTDMPGDFGRYESAPQLGNFKKYVTGGNNNNPLIEFTKLTGEENDYCYFCSFDICNGNAGHNTNYRLAFSHNGNIGFTYGTYLGNWNEWNLLATQSYVQTAYNNLYKYTKGLESKISYISNWIIKLHK